jgi:hypothetical protein
VRRVIPIGLALAGVVTAAEARLARIEVSSRTDVLEGKPFGLAGPYEKLVGRAYFAVRPDNPHNRQIIDLDKAPRNQRGEVEFAADIFILRPKDAARGNGSLLIELPNRGGKAILRLINRAAGSLDPSAPADFGDGFLMRQGFTVAWVGWQFDAREERGLMRLDAPIARSSSGSLVGLLRSDFVVPAKSKDYPLGHLILGRIGGSEYPVDQPQSESNMLTVRDEPTDQRRLVPRNAWSFARDRRAIHLESGFEPGRIYELIYTVKDPAVAGLGLAALRDFVSHLKYAKDSPARIARAEAVGISQSGRFLRHFLYQDFNVDEEGRQVLDGVIAHVPGAGRGSFNHRFAQPSRDAQPMSSLFYPTDLFPFTDSPLKSPMRGAPPQGLLDASRASGTLPKIFHTNTSYDYWSRAGSLIHTSPDGKSDVEPPENVRIYFLAGLQHFSGPFPPAVSEVLDLRSQQKQNPNPVVWLWRALLTSLDDWVRGSQLPPPSAYPRVSDGTLVTLEALRFPSIPGIRPPAALNRAYALDFGKSFRDGIISEQPPKVGEVFNTLVPQVDPDGNDRGGVRIPEMRVPLATYTGWNLRDPSIGASSQRVSFLGSYIPFPKTLAERERAADPRPSVAERYSSREQYLGLFAEAALQAVRERSLLAEDLPAVIERGEAEWREATR